MAALLPRVLEEIVTCIATSMYTNISKLVDLCLCV